MRCLYLPRYSITCSGPAIDRDPMGHQSEMQSKLCDVAAVIGNQAFAFLVDGCVFNKLLPGRLETWNRVAGLFD